MKRFPNSMGIFLKNPLSIQTPESVGLDAFYSVYTGAPIAHADAEHLVAQALLWWSGATGKTGVPTPDEITPFVESAIACSLKGGIPINASALTYDGQGGCKSAAAAQPLPKPPVQTSPAQPVPKPPVQTSPSQQPVQTPQTDPAKTPSEGISGSSGLLLGGLIAAVAIGIVAMTLNQNTKKKGTSR